MTRPPMISATRQLALQSACAVLVLSLTWPFFSLRQEPVPWAEICLAIGFLAFIVAAWTRQPVWWRLIHTFFAPLAWSVMQLDIDPGWFLLACILLLLIYRGALTGQVPLYLSNTETVVALEKMLAERPRFRFIDIGSGIGTTVLPLARRFPDSHFVGVENAPLTWLTGYWRCRHQPNLKWRWGSYWTTNLANFDFVYAFLSPAPMAELWQKAKTEMLPGSLLISNSFPIPDIEPQQIVEIDCNPMRTLYCYRLPAP